LATWLLEKSQGVVLSQKNKKDRLISYYHTIGKESELPDYVKTGGNK